MSENNNFKVPYTKILNILPHPDPATTKLEIAVVYGYHVIIKKNQYKVGDGVLYIPVDSILPPELEAYIFGSDSKIKLHKGRVRQIRIRQYPSLGMLLELTQEIIDRCGRMELEENYADHLKIVKYEPPVTTQQLSSGLKPRDKPLENPRFHKYNGVTNLKWMPEFFKDQEVVIQCKLHGSCIRFSYTKTATNTVWKKIKKFLRILPEYEYCYGSNNVQIQDRGSYTGFYGEDIYGAVLKKLDAFSKLKKGETVYGELIGPGIQKNYTYGHNEHHMVIYDVKVEKEDGSQEYLDPEQAQAYAKEREFDFVPVLYTGVYDEALAKELSTGPSVYCPEQLVKEGVVVKARVGYGFNSDKKALKIINEKYLDDKSNTDFH